MSGPSTFSPNSFAHLADVSSHPGSALFSSSWCPTMDLFVLATPLSNRHRLTLWKMGGSKLWDVEVGRGDAEQERIVDVDWSPSGLEIAVAHDPPRLSIHSVHDGREIRSLHIPALQKEASPERVLAKVWWLEGEKSPEPDSIDNLLKRNGNVPGSAHSLLQMLPLLDALSEEADGMSAPIYNLRKDAKDGKLHRKTSNLPPALESFPTLLPNPTSASISPKSTSSAHTNAPNNRSHDKDGGPSTAKAPENEDRDADVENSLVVVSDSTGSLHLFLEGSFALGEIILGRKCITTSITKPSLKNKNSVLLAIHGSHHQSTDLLPVPIVLPLLSTPSLTSVAKASTTVRALLVYIHRTLEEMRRAWFGTDSLEGGRDAGKKWIKLLEEKEKQLDGRKKTHPIYELTNLLFTGKTSGAMREFLGGSGKLSERGMAQWDSTVHAALTVLQESAERKITPACERLVIVLEEVRGWSAWPQRYSAYNFITAEIDECLALSHRAIELAEWLSKAALEEFDRFQEFMKWTKVETSRVTDGQVGDLRAPTYDPLEVSDYLENGLLDSSLDKWFVGPLPKKNPSQVHPPSVSTMADVLAQMRGLIAGDQASYVDPTSSSSAMYAARTSCMERELDRNLIALSDELIVGCSRIFSRAARATGREAVVPTPRPPIVGTEELPVPQSAPTMLIRERVVLSRSEGHQSGGMPIEYIAVALPKGWNGGHDDRALAVFGIQFQGTDMRGPPTRIRCCVLQCRALEGGGGGGDDDNEGAQPSSLEILDLAFFDNETLLLVMRTLVTSDEEEEEEQGSEFGRPYLMSVAFNELQYADLAPETWPESRERLMERALKMSADGLLQAHPVPITRSRRLNCCTVGETATLAVNGRDTRRCACVLDGAGQYGEIFDMDAEGDDDDDKEEDEEEEEAGGDVGTTTVQEDGMEE